MMGMHIYIVSVVPALGQPLWLSAAKSHVGCLYI